MKLITQLEIWLLGLNYLTVEANNLADNLVQTMTNPSNLGNEPPGTSACPSDVLINDEHNSILE